MIPGLIEEALNAREYAYVPYSHFKVGAALLTDDGVIYKGCNIENASYGATNCAERTAFFKAVSEGKHAFKAIAVVGGREGEEIADYAFPCGICRQVMLEFCGSDFVVIVAKSVGDYKRYTLDEIIPCGFSSENL
ncbi:MAG: cytidine deaminase [Lachnospiraceae bacterium]|nr:cytidine deaminase [Lachnospiraceae bacterium]